MTPEWAAIVLGVLAFGGFVLWLRERHVPLDIKKDWEARWTALLEKANGHDVAVANAQSRLTKLETAMRIDGQKITAEANRAALPAFMR